MVPQASSWKALEAWYSLPSLFPPWKRLWIKVSLSVLSCDSFVEEWHGYGETVFLTLLNTAVFRCYASLVCWYLSAELWRSHNISHPWMVVNSVLHQIELGLFSLPSCWCHFLNYFKLIKRFFSFIYESVFELIFYSNFIVSPKLWVLQDN